MTDRGAVGALLAVATLIVSAVISPLTGVSLPTLGWLAVSIALLIVGVGALATNRDWLAYIAGFAFLVFGFAWWAPVWRPMVYALLVKNPGGIQWLLVGIIGAAAVALFGNTRRSGTSTFALVLLGLGVFGFLVIGPWVSGMYAHVDMANQVEANAEQVEAPPESVANNSRIAPLTVSENWATNSLQYPRYQLSGGDITYINGTPHWSWSLSPDGVVNEMTRKQRGAVYVNQSSMSKDIVVHDEQQFEYGQGVKITDNVMWQVSQRDYLKEYGETFVVPHDGKSYMVIPYKTHDWRMKWTPLPQMYTVPQFGGVKIVHQDGTIEDVPASEVEDHPVLEGQNYYPYDLARFKVKSMAYKHGILNTWFGHKDQIELAAVPGDGNQQPFTIPTKDGPTYLLAVEPWGNANGVYQVWTVDAQTGDMKYTQLNQENALRGPRKAVDSIEAHPTISRLNDVKAVEPIPVVRDGTLYWQVRIVPDSSARVTYVAFFNADTEDVTVVETTGQVQAFLAEDQTLNESANESSDSEQQQRNQCAFRIVITHPDGSTDTVCAPEGSTIEVQTGNETQTGGN